MSVLEDTVEETHELHFSDTIVGVVVHTDGRVDINIGGASFDGNAFEKIVAFVEQAGQIKVTP